MRNRAMAFVWLFLCNALWGFSFIGTKFALGAGLAPMSLAFFRYVIVVPVLLVIEKKMVKERKIEKGDALTLVASSFFGVTLYYFFENTGMLYTTASNASLIVATVPVITLAVDAIFFKARVSPLQWVGAALSVAGVALVVGGGYNFSRETLVGNMLVFGGCATWVAYLLASRKLLIKYDSVLITSRQSLVALLTLIPFGLADMRGWPDFTWPLAGVVAALGLLCSGACYLWYVDAIQTLGTVTVSVFLNFVPVFAVVSATLFLKEELSTLQLAGGLVILTGITLVTIAPMRAVKGVYEA